MEASVLAGTIEQLRQSTATWVATSEAELRIMRTELAELREFQRMTLEAEERVRTAACSVPCTVAGRVYVCLVV